METDAAVIADTWRRWEGYQPRIERDVFGTIDASVIIAAVDRFCKSHLGSGIERYELYSAGVGSVHGLRLRDGRRVVVKAHRGEVNVDHLGAVQVVQRHLADAAFPAPRPLLGPTRLAQGVATVEKLLDRGHWADAHQPRIRKLVARGLAQQIELARELADLSGLRSWRSVIDEHWHTPHDRRFDFAGTADGAAWIEHLAAEARRQLDQEASEGQVVGHNDWRVEHLRFDDGSLAAVWDWESLCVGPEAAFAGSAAHAFVADYRIDNLDCVPTLDEAIAFLADYEEARGGESSAGERRVAKAALVATMSYTARCEHADALTDTGTCPARPAPRRVSSDSYRGFLAAHGPVLLEVAVTGVPAVFRA